MRGSIRASGSRWSNGTSLAEGGTWQITLVSGPGCLGFTELHQLDENA
ncbi:hypothetical protein ACIO3O_32730 [Streptomyces sp. NPDC087440]